MRALALLVVLALPCAAQDAPVAVAVDAGYVTLTPGTFLPAPLDVETANRLTDAESRPTKTTLAVVVSAAVAVAAACFAAGYVAGKRK